MNNYCQSFPNYNETGEGIVWMRRNNNHRDNKDTATTANKFVSNNLSEKLEHMVIGSGETMENDKVETVFGNDEVSTDDNGSEHESISDNEIALNDEDVWDDSLLIKMYENSQAQINTALIERFTNQTNQDTTANKNSTNNNTVNKKKPSSKGKTNAGNNKSVTTTIKQQPVTKPVYNWKVNDFCRLTYSEDNIEYEAKIISINSQDKSCLVRYIGYENEEVRNLCEVNPSAGEYVRKMQINMAIQDGYGQPEENATESVSKSDSKQVVPPSQTASTSIPFIPEMSQQPINIQACRIIPPPPPFGESIANTLSTGPTKDEDDVLASMLMSWYMTGYHTGYYQARKDLQNNQTCKCCNKQ